jgi:hypothetical protein
VALLSAGALSPSYAFTMIAGSRLGASFIVLLVGFIYALRGHERWTALAAGVLSLLLTGSIQLLALPMGLLILGRGWLDHFSLPALDKLAAGVNRGLKPLIDPLAAFLPDWALFVVGVGLVTLSFRLFDQAMPQVHLEKTNFGQTTRLIYRPEVMFLMGLVITLLTPGEHYPLHPGGEHFHPGGHAGRGGVAGRPPGGDGGGDAHSLRDSSFSASGAVGLPALRAGRLECAGLGHPRA